jgi:hypothetical protein
MSMKPRKKKHSPASRIHRLATAYGYESRDSWGEREGKAQFDIFWLKPMPAHQKLAMLKQIFGALKPATLTHYETAACAYAATHARKWWVRVQVHYKIGAHDSGRIEETDYQLEDAVHINQLHEFHNSTVEEMKAQIMKKSVNSIITDVRWLALPRPLPGAGA